MLPQKPVLPASARRSRRGLVLRGVRHRDVAGQDVEQRRDVGRALDAGVAAQGQDPAARAADVAEQQLQDRRRRGCSARRRCGGSSRPRSRTRWSAPARCCGSAPPRPLEELRGADPADLLHHLRGVPREVALEDLEDAAGVLQRLVALPGLADPRSARARRLRTPGAWASCRPRPPPEAAELLVLDIGRWPAGPAAPRRETRRTGVLPGLGVVGCRTPGPSRRTARRGPRCRGSPR